MEYQHASAFASMPYIANATAPPTSCPALALARSAMVFVANAAEWRPVLHRRRVNG
jgi:hypothetical protein